MTKNRGLNMKGVIIGIIAFFIALMVIVWVVAERTDPEMIPQSDQQQKNR